MLSFLGIQPLKQHGPFAFFSHEPLDPGDDALLPLAQRIDLRVAEVGLEPGLDHGAGGSQQPFIEAPRAAFQGAGFVEGRIGREGLGEIDPADLPSRLMDQRVVLVAAGGPGQDLEEADLVKRRARLAKRLERASAAGFRGEATSEG